MKQPRLLLIALTALGGLSLAAQERKKIDFHLNHFLEQRHAPGEEVDLFVHGSVAGVSDAVRSVGGRVKMSLGRLVSARVPISEVRNLAASPAVERFEFSLYRGELLNDSMRVRAHVNEVQAGLAPLPQAYNGEGVVVGIIDTGVDHNHPDFENADGTTRIAYYWDQALSGSGAPPEFGYGREWNAAQIDAGQMVATDNNGHGTTVAGTATGNGLATGKHKGVAPNADIIVVNFSGANFTAAVADGVKYVFDRAAAMGKPAVLNVSLGTYAGSHDGKDAAALFVDSLINAERGRVLVCAAGNYNQAPFFHVRTEVDSDTSFTWFGNNTNGPPYNIFNFPNVFFEVWADAADFENVRFAMGADRITPSYQYRGRTDYRRASDFLGSVVSDPLISASGNLLGTVQYFAQMRGDQVQLQVLIAQPDSGTYNFRFMSTGSGRFDVWSTVLIGTSNMCSTSLPAPWNVPTVGEYPPMANYVMPDNEKHIVDSWACSDRTLTVANAWNQVSYTAYSGNFINSGATPGMISANSSAGPTRDLRWKPDLAAPGDVTMTTWPLPALASLIANEPDKVDPDGMHARAGGTSIASPVVCGAVALYLQKCPNASWEQVRQAFITTAFGDALTGILPNKYFGNGRVHAFDAVVSSNIPDITITAPDDQVCSNTTVEVAAPAGFDAYLWSNGATDNPTSYLGEGPLSVVASTATGCASSNALTFTVLAAPAVPVITADQNDLTSTPAPAYQWLLNGGDIVGADQQSYTALVTGTYSVRVTDINGCSATSAPEQVVINSVGSVAGNDFALWPSPAGDRLSVSVPNAGSSTLRVQVIDARGSVVTDERMPYAPLIELPLSRVVAGTYTLRIMQGDQRLDSRFVKLP